MSSGSARDDQTSQTESPERNVSETSKSVEELSEKMRQMNTRKEKDKERTRKKRRNRTEEPRKAPSSRYSTLVRHETTRVKING